MADFPNLCSISYRRSRFSTKLPPDRRYSAAHFWLAETEPGTWRVGFTRFATRMLGDHVESGFEVKPGAAVTVGQTIGWFEGFKATSDLFCVADGVFAGVNPALEADPALIDADPYGKGWLYLVRGQPDPMSVDAQGYVAILDAAIDAVQGKTGQAQPGEDSRT